MDATPETRLGFARSQKSVVRSIAALLPSTPEYTHPSYWRLSPGESPFCLLETSVTFEGTEPVRISARIHEDHLIAYK